MTPPWLLLTALLLFLVEACRFHDGTEPPTGQVTWTMLPVSKGQHQADSSLIEFPDGATILIDAGGEPKALFALLRARKVRKLDWVLITHAHKDHYLGLTGLLDSGIKIKKVYFNLPERGICDEEKPWGCDYEDVIHTHVLLEKKGVAVDAVHQGDVLYKSNETLLKVLYAYDGITTPVGRTDINDTSVVVLLSHGTTRVLFTGDLNAKLGGYLAAHPEGLAAELLKMPHHGTEGCVPNTFFDAVHPKEALVPAPGDLWANVRSKRIRNYFDEKKIPVWVDGINGAVTVRLRQAGYEVVPERRAITLAVKTSALSSP